MKKSNRIIFGSILGAMFPLFLSMLAVLIGFYLIKNEANMPYLVAAGFITGIVLDILFLKRLIIKIFELPLFVIALIMTLICISSGFLASNEKTIGEEIQNMLGLNFTPSKGLILAEIIIGGSALILVQYFLTKIVLIKTIKITICYIN